MKTSTLKEGLTYVGSLRQIALLKHSFFYEVWIQDVKAFDPIDSPFKLGSDMQRNFYALYQVLELENPDTGGSVGYHIAYLPFVRECLEGLAGASRATQDLLAIYPTLFKQIRFELIGHEWDLVTD